MNSTATPPSDTATATTRWRLCDHPPLVAMWGASFACMGASHYLGSDFMGRWALLLGLASLLASCASLALWLRSTIVTRITEIVSYWEEDVRRPRRELRVVPSARAHLSQVCDEGTPS